MASSYTSDELVDEIRATAMIPDADSPGSTPVDLLKYADSALRTKILPELLKFREEYGVVTTRTPVVANTPRYRLPTRSAGLRLRDILYVMSDGTRRSLDHIGREELDRHTSTTGEPGGFYLEGNYIVLVPTPSAASGSIETPFYFQTSDLTLIDNARQVTAVNLSLKQITLSGATVPAAFTGGVLLDVHSKHSGSEIKVWDVTQSGSPSGQVITITEAIDGTVPGTTAVEVGDWVCLAGNCTIPAIPRELHPMLARAAAMRFAEALGDSNKAQIHAALIRDDMQAMGSLINSRVEGRPIIIGGSGGMFREGRRW